MPARFEDVTSEQRRDVPLDHLNRRYANEFQDDIVISGFSGRLPESSNIDEFKKNLLEGIDMVTDAPRRWPAGLYDLPTRTGKIKDEDLENFDMQFFSVHQKQAECMDAQLRMLLEATYESIIDAGYNPQELKGTRTGVYIGVSNSETEQYWCADPDRVNGYGLTGCCRAMFPNRISYTFDFKGPSFAVDTACSSSLVALAQAFRDIRDGYCDAAFVGGSSLLLKPTMSLQFKRLGMLSAEGKCKAFDSTGAGYVRSEGVVVLFIQKASDARRNYASLLNVRTNTDGFKDQGITFPDGRIQNRLIRETYEEIGLNPHDVTYIEAHGTGTKVGDPQEVNSITDFFCKDRQTPLLMGSVKSNMGHSEPASGVCSIAKVLVAMEAGVIPANLHYKEPNPDLYGILDGRLKVVDRNTPWNGGIVALNSFGFGGANAHVILKSNPKPKVLSPGDGFPRLAVVSGRTPEGVQTLLEDVEAHKDDEEYIGMINELHSRNIPLHYHRGYTVCGNNVNTVREVAELVDDNRPIWYIYSGMGSQWASMARDLMQIEVFNKSIHRCAEALRTENVDLLDVLTRSDDETFNNILNSFISIAAVQVALTDLLTHIGISPDGIVGHSVGELGCAYADGCFTPEQTVLAAYWRGRSILETQLQPGMMAAIGLSWEDTHKRAPKDVIPACHNSNDSVTISGPTESVKKFVDELTKEQVFAKAVKSSGIAFHSKYIAEAGPKLRKSLDKIIPSPKNRSPRWISSSIPESAWNTPIAAQSSAAYHVNNLLSPVLFHEAIQHVPKNAICIEIAPTGLLQAILKRSLGSEVTNLSLMKRDHENNVVFLLSNLGKLYSAGAQPQVTKLYRPISYPVSRGTPGLSSKIGWNHTTKFFIPNFASDSQSGETVIDVNLSKEEDAYLAGHTIDGRILFPATGYLTLAWRTFAKMKNNSMEKTPVVFEDVVFHRATILPKDGSVKFGINFFDGTGRFEICESGSLAVSGKISVPEDVEREHLGLDPLQSDKSGLSLKKGDVYKELRLRGYDYGGLFRGINEVDATATTGTLEWEDNWISFMDTMLQFGIIGKDFRELYLPTRIERVTINPVKHYEIVENLKKVNKHVPVYQYKDYNVTRSGGVEMRGLKASLAPRRQGTQAPPTLEKYVFVPNDNNKELSESIEKNRLHAVAVAVKIVIENSNNALKIKAMDLACEKNSEASLATILQEVIEGEPTLACDVVAVASSNHVEAFNAAVGDSGIRVISKEPTGDAIESNCHLAVSYEIFSRPNGTTYLKTLRASIKEDGFILLEEILSDFQKNKNGKELFDSLNLVTVTIQKSGNKVYVLLRPKIDLNSRKMAVVQLTEKNYHWLSELKKSLVDAEKENQYVYMVVQGEEFFGAVGLINCIKNEVGGKFARMIYIQDSKAEKFSFTNDLYKKQLEKDLITNVLKNGSWGTFKHLKLECQPDAPTLQVEHAYINALTKGDLSSLKWIEAPLSNMYNEDSKLEFCSVYYAPINFRDVMLCSGKLAADALPGDLGTQDCVLGLEFSGRDSKGKRIMAMVQAKSLATTCLAQKNMLWEIPDNWTMEEASTVPCVYSTVYYALLIRGRMRKGEKILIHAGSGGVGQAAISVALHHGLEVFTTVGSKEKREFLKKRFPALKDSHIGNSRDTSFEQMIMRETKGKGVQLVLNSLAEEKLQASVRCLGLNGRFLEIGKFDLSNNNPLGMSVFLKNTQFHGILVDSIMENDDDTIAEVVKMVADGIKNGAVRPLPTSVFNDQQVEQAFRFMASGKHIGKVVIKVRDEKKQKITKPTPKLISAIPRTYLLPDKTYIIVGGLGGFGLELANWMVARGARNIVLTSRSGVKTGYQALMIRRWKEHGVKVVIDTNDVTTLKGAQNLLRASNKLGLVGAIFNLAAVLRDNTIENQTEDDYKAVCVPKVDGTRYLDMASRELCPELDYFICFSSVSCGRGNIGQSNYGLANSTMERICENRQTAGLPGTSIQWGAIGDTGLVIENLGDNDTVIGGTLPQRMTSCLQTIDLFMQQPNAVLASMVIAEKRKAETGGGVSLVMCVANILGLKDIKNVPNQSTLADLGMDSLMGAEIKQTLERNYDVVLSAQEIRLLSFGKLKELESGEGAAATSSASDSPVGDGTQVVFSSELMPKKCLVELPSKSSDKKKQPIFFIHAIEGAVSALKPLAEKLNRPVWGLQCVAEAPLDSLESLAKYYVSMIKQVQPKGPYVIAGYSFGGSVAFEMVHQLEMKKDRAALIMLDGSPQYVSWYTEAHVKRLEGGSSPAQDEAYALAYFGMICAGIDYVKTAKELESLSSWNARLDHITKLITPITHHSEEELRITASHFYKKLHAAHVYNPTYKINGDITLIKPTENYTKLAEDYGLSKACVSPVAIHVLKGDHRTFIQSESGDKVAVIIDEFCSKI